MRSFVDLNDFFLEGTSTFIGALLRLDLSCVDQLASMFFEFFMLDDFFYDSLSFLVGTSSMLCAGLESSDALEESTANDFAFASITLFFPPL